MIIIFPGSSSVLAFAEVYTSPFDPNFFFFFFATSFIMSKMLLSVCWLCFSFFNPFMIRRIWLPFYTSLTCQEPPWAFLCQSPFIAPPVPFRLTWDSGQLSGPGYLSGRAREENSHSLFSSSGSKPLISPSFLCFNLSLYCQLCSSYCFQFSCIKTELSFLFVCWF